ncbi:hypothetical protein [Celerinatantimonas sp. YJH-8]|uniref:hypothetical protein n=1 Tax=Celerinatantimonas sp. YJH-8 TaxID=3228714 RepID=UPI0038C5624B
MTVQKHSGVGIAAFVISIISLLFIFFLMFLLGIMTTAVAAHRSALSTGILLISFLSIVPLLMNLVALGLGIAGLLQRDRKKIFPILGTILSGIIVISLLSMIVLGIVHG